MRFVLVIFLMVAVSCSNESVEKEAIPKVASMTMLDSSALASLDSVYMSAISIDSLNTVFHSEDEQLRLGECWVEFHTNVSTFLRSRGLRLESNDSFFTTLYCNKDGSVDHFIYAFNNKVSSAMESQFSTLLTEYLTNHGLGIAAPRPFQQCGGVEYRVD